MQWVELLNWRGLIACFFIQFNVGALGFRWGEDQMPAQSTFAPNWEDCGEQIAFSRSWAFMSCTSSEACVPSAPVG